MAFFSRLNRVVGVFAVLLLLAGCASTIEESAEGPRIHDPIEPVNRVFFAFNDVLDTVALKPAAFVYKSALPDPIQDMVRNFLRWLRSPVILANSLLQGDIDNAGDATRRFFVNGLTVGLIDWGDGLGWGYRDEDFGQTLGVHGVEGGPYLVLPVLGPSNGRDLVGRVVDIFFDPLTYIVSGPGARNAITISRAGGEAVDFRARNYDTINDLKESSVDYYARVRSIYLQRRESEIRNGEAAEQAETAERENQFQDFSPSDRPRSVTGELPGKTN